MSEITLRATSKGHTVEHFHIPKGDYLHTTKHKKSRAYFIVYKQNQTEPMS